MRHRDALKKKRQKISSASEFEVAASSVGTAMAIIQATMTRLRGSLSVNAPDDGSRDGRGPACRRKRSARRRSWRHERDV